MDHPLKTQKISPASLQWPPATRPQSQDLPAGCNASWTNSGQPAEIIKTQWFTMQLRYIEVANFSTLLWSCDVDLQDETGRFLLPCSECIAKLSRLGAAISLSSWLQRFKVFINSLSAGWCCIHSSFVKEGRYSLRHQCVSTWASER